jgi:hypothetical protein
MTNRSPTNAFQPLTASVAKEFLTRGGWTREEAALILNGLDPLANEELIKEGQAPAHPMIQTYLRAFERFQPNKRVISVEDWLDWAIRGTNQEPRQLPLTFSRDLFEAFQTGNFERLARLIAHRLETHHQGALEPWWIQHPEDPEPVSRWYTPARYFARQWIKREPGLLNKRDSLATKVEQDLIDRHIYKRGDKRSPKASSIKNSLSNVNLRA